jgi:23S rRNA (adenine2503-C2)-methyltransferase
MVIGGVDLLDLSFDGLLQTVVDWGQPRFRAAQIWHWIYKSLVTDPEQMSNLPKDLRNQLKERAYIGHLRPVATITADDGLTEKVLFQTANDQQTFESVLMCYADRNTVCVSSQIGCPLACAFCATGRRGLVRNLTTGEIIAQVMYFARKLLEQKLHVTNVVFMGMGEPMLNFDAVWQAILNLNDHRGFALGSRRFTISTAGVVPGIERLARESLSVGLAISLNAPNNALRNQLMPLNRRYPLERLMAAAKLYVEHTGRRVSFEYVLAKDVNDSEAHAEHTATLLRGMLCHVNLIPLNPIPGCDYEPSPWERVLRFQRILTQGGIQATVRVSRGSEICAGCGQLRGLYTTAGTQKTGDLNSHGESGDLGD